MEFALPTGLATSNRTAHSRPISSFARIPILAGKPSRGFWSEPFSPSQKPEPGFSACCPPMPPAGPTWRLNWRPPAAVVRSHSLTSTPQGVPFRHACDGERPGCAGSRPSTKPSAFWSPTA